MECVLSYKSLRSFLCGIRSLKRFSFVWCNPADKYKVALDKIGLVANKMQPKQKGQVCVWYKLIWHRRASHLCLKMHTTTYPFFAQILDCMRHAGFCVDDLKDMGWGWTQQPLMLNYTIKSVFSWTFSTRFWDSFNPNRSKRRPSKYRTARLMHYS